MHQTINQPIQYPFHSDYAYFRMECYFQSYPTDRVIYDYIKIPKERLIDDTFLSRVEVRDSYAVSKDYDFPYTMEGEVDYDVHGENLEYIDCKQLPASWVTQSIELGLIDPTEIKTIDKLCRTS